MLDCERPTLHARERVTARMARSHGGILTVIPLVSALIGAGAQAQMGPAMNSFLMNVKTDHEQCGAATFAANRPAAWRHAVTAPTIERAGQGVFMITAPGAAPLPGTSPRAGFFVDVTAVGSNAHCFEDSDYVRGSDFQSQVRCVRPDGSPVDSEFAWSYRSDSLDLVQYSVYRANFGYAQIGTDGALASFFTPAAHALVTSKRLGKGRFKVVFGKLGTASADMVPGVDASVQVSEICRTPACASDTCSVAAWSIGATSSTVDVRCFTKKGEPVDASFRVFIGQDRRRSTPRSSAFRRRVEEWATVSTSVGSIPRSAGQRQARGPSRTPTSSTWRDPRKPSESGRSSTFTLRRASTPSHSRIRSSTAQPVGTST